MFVKFFFIFPLRAIRNDFFFILMFTRKNMQLSILYYLCWTRIS